MNKNTMVMMSALVVGGAFCAQAAERPNVVLIFADDLGYADVGYHGSPDVVTPNIDSIAQNGVQFSAGYVSAPVCGPSRAGLRTGCYQTRFGAEDNAGPYKRSEDVKIGIPTSIRTTSERMQELGYVTGMIGKSHTGKAAEFHPNSSGFDEFFGFINGASNYRPDGRFGKAINKKDNPIMRQRNALEESEYLTDAFGREAVEFIDRHADEKFFLYLPFNAIHGPMQATDLDLEKFKSIKDETRRLAVAMNWNMDQNIGKVMKALKTHGLFDNTLVVFLSDNGGKPHNNGSLNIPLRGYKGQLWDGGIRIPFCMQWPAQIKSGQKCDIPIISLDILPSFVAAAGGQVKDKVDGVNLIPLVTGKVKDLSDRYLYWRFNRQWAIRDANWKLVFERGAKKPQLFNIADDISESNDLYNNKPEIAKRLQDSYDALDSEMMPKLWGWDKSFLVHDPKMGKE